MYEKKKVYIAAKTYPTISEKYAELVCTAGVLEDGTWIRLYPIPFRQLKDEQKYQKYTWIEVEAERNTSDFRPESYRPDLNTLISKPHGKNRPNWEERKRILFHNQTLYTNMKELIQLAKSRNNPISLAIFKPTKIIDLSYEKTTPNWDPKKLASLEAQSKQLHLFKDENELKEEFRVAQKIPYTFRYLFEDEQGNRSKLTIEDWEIGMLYLRCLKRAEGKDETALQKVREKYYRHFLNKDIYFILGTTLAHHQVSRNPFLIISVFYPPMPSTSYQQLSLFDL